MQPLSGIDPVEYSHSQLWLVQASSHVENSQLIPIFLGYPPKQWNQLLGTGVWVRTHWQIPSQYLSLILLIFCDVAGTSSELGTFRLGYNRYFNQLRHRSDNYLANTAVFMYNISSSIYKRTHAGLELEWYDSLYIPPWMHKPTLWSHTMYCMY